MLGVGSREHRHDDPGVISADGPLHRDYQRPEWVYVSTQAARSWRAWPGIRPAIIRDASTAWRKGWPEVQRAMAR